MSFPSFVRLFHSLSNRFHRLSVPVSVSAFSYKTGIDIERESEIPQNLPEKALENALSPFLATV